VDVTENCRNLEKAIPAGVTYLGDYTVAIPFRYAPVIPSIVAVVVVLIIVLIVVVACDKRPGACKLKPA
jgi:hypothetical protein